MYYQLQEYVPPAALPACLQLIEGSGLHIQVVNKRVTKHGDYKSLPGGGHRITVNSMDNPYRFLITLIHEIAHWKAFSKYGRKIKPHGQEWKQSFKLLMLPFLNPHIFPAVILSPLAAHMKNPKASSSTDSALIFALQQFDPKSELQAVANLPKGSIFKMYNGKVFKRGNVRVKRIECIEVPTGRLYLFQPHAEVKLIDN